MHVILDFPPKLIITDAHALLLLWLHDGWRTDEFSHVKSAETDRFVRSCIGLLGTKADE
jgi:hypothetical protein